MTENIFQTEVYQRILTTKHYPGFWIELSIYRVAQKYLYSRVNEILHNRPECVSQCTGQV